MSAFLCNPHHIAQLVRNAEVRGPADEGREACQMLCEENMRSLAARYPDCADDPAQFFMDMTSDEYIAETQRAWMSDVYERLEPVAILSMIRCYQYQSCETEDYFDSDAEKFIQQLQAKMIRALPGFEDAPWEYTPGERVANDKTVLVSLTDMMAGNA